MPEKKIIDWCKKQLDKGQSEEELTKSLFQQGYTGKEVEKIIEEAKGTLHSNRISKEVIEWCREQLDSGIAKQKIEELLFQQGYIGREVKIIFEEAEQPPPPLQKKILEPPEKKGIYEISLPEEAIKEKPKPRYKEVKRKTRKTPPVSVLLANESNALWSSVAIVIFSMLLVTGVTIFFLTMSPEGRSWWDPEPQKVDELPPVVNVSLSTPFFVEENLQTTCTDKGVDYSSGCEQQTTAYLLTKEKECPKDYLIYSKDLPVEDGFLCVAVKDREGNVGFSEPLNVSFDRVSPVSELEVLGGWFDGDFVVGVSDFDEGSGLGSCFYRVLSGGRTVISWVERECGGEVSVPAGKQGCKTEGENACTVEVYSQDKVGNKANISSQSFNIDFNPPTAEIIELKPSKTVSGNTILKKQKIQVIGTAKDPNMKSYSLTLKHQGKTEQIKNSSQSMTKNLLATLDLTNKQEGDYVLSLEVTDKTGKTNKVHKQFALSTSGEACNPGEITDCFWLKGVCKEGFSECKKGSWSTCDLSEVLYYENQETSCEDKKDNDCDGETDEEDPDCEGVCSNECTEDTCSEGMLYSCEDCDEDECLDLCDAMNCSEGDGENCQCDCSPYTTSNEDSVPGGCGDGVDNDCDGLEDSEDDDCDNCKNPGEQCTTQEECCNHCDSDDSQTCFQCTSCYEGNYCSNQDSECDDLCGADQECDDTQGTQMLSSCSFGQPYFKDQCDNCFVQDSNTCSSEGACTADEPCNGLNPGDSCSTGMTCSASCECITQCTPQGAYCTSDSQCCSGLCDPSDNHCTSCGGSGNHFDNVDGTCEEECGVYPPFDEHSPGYNPYGNPYCATYDCDTDITVGSCSCSSGTCSSGYCRDYPTCHYNVECGVEGWESSTCTLQDSCGEGTLIEKNKNCYSNGCNGVRYFCRSSSHECDYVSCGGQGYWCTSTGTGYHWIRSDNMMPEGIPYGNCEDGIDNDCQDGPDGEDPDCS